MYLSRTFLVFLGLLGCSWVLELGGGIELVQWYWGVHWQVWSTQPTYGQALAALFGPKVSVSQVVLFWVALYVALHGICVLSAFVFPLRRCWNIGARRPSERERDQFETAYAMLSRAQMEVVIAPPRRWFVVDGLGMQMRWIGSGLLIDREVLAHRYFPALLAHYLCAVQGEDRLAHRLYGMLPPWPLVVGGLIGLPCSIGLVLLYPLWMWYWRERVYLADAYAVALGQGYALISALDELYLKLDQPSRGGRVLKSSPYIEQRIGRIQSLLRISTSPSGII